MCPVQTKVWDHWGAMVLAARPVVGTLDEARDCASQAIVQYLEGDRRDVVNLEAFMVTIAKRRAIDHARARERARARDERLAHEIALSAPDVAEDVAARAEARWVDLEARRLLQPRVYELLQLVADGVPLVEVAQRLGMTERAAESHLLRARRVVRAALARTLVGLGAVLAGVRRWWGPAAVTAPVLATAFVLALGAPGAPAVAPEPSWTLLPAVEGGAAVGRPTTGPAITASSRRTGPGVAGSGKPVAPPAPDRDVYVRFPGGAIGVENRDNGHQSDDLVEAWVWCLQHLKVEVGYVGCDTENASPQQGARQPAGDRPLVPALR